MKMQTLTNIFRSSALFLMVTLMLLLTQTNVPAQAKWVPGSISMYISGIETYHDWSECPGNVHDTSWQESGSENIGISNSWGYLSAYSRIGNTITISWSTPYNGDPCLYEVQISFDLDSINGKLNNVHMSYNSPDYQGGCVRSLISIPQVNFKIQTNSGDTILVSDGVSSDSVTSASFDHSTFGYCNVRLAHYGTEHGLTKGSIGYSITLVIQQLPNAVHSVTNENGVFSVLSSLPDNSIHFSFPASDQSQQMLIYDILGRKISKIDIPARDTNYIIPSLNYPKGTFFVRLGLQTASFIVN